MERIEVMELVEYELELRGVELSQLANQVSHGSSCRWVSTSSRRSRRWSPCFLTHL